MPVITPVESSLIKQCTTFYTQYGNKYYKLSSQNRPQLYTHSHFIWTITLRSCNSKNSLKIHSFAFLTVLVSRFIIFCCSNPTPNKPETPWNDLCKRTAAVLHYQKVKEGKSPERCIFLYLRALGDQKFDVSFKTKTSQTGGSFHWYYLSPTIPSMHHKYISLEVCKELHIECYNQKRQRTFKYQQCRKESTKTEWRTRIQLIEESQCGGPRQKDRLIFRQPGRPIICGLKGRECHWSPRGQHNTILGPLCPVTIGPLNTHKVFTPIFVRTSIEIVHHNYVPECTLSLEATSKHIYIQKSIYPQTVLCQRVDVRKHYPACNMPHQAT